jgi:FkbM family methyltransferase
MTLRPNSTVSYRLGVFGVWEPVVSQFMREHISDGAVCIDIGANIGYYTLLMSHASPHGIIYAIEPSPPILSELNANVAMNGYTNVVVVPYGVSDKVETLNFHLKDHNRGSSAFAEDGEVRLELWPLADVVPPEHLARTEMLKIDVEGMEDRVMAHVFDILDKFPRRLTICAELRIDPSIRALLAQFQQAGFTSYVLENEYSSFFYASTKNRSPRPMTDLPDGMHDVALVRK